MFADQPQMVPPTGFEPMTSALQKRRSANWATRANLNGAEQVGLAPTMAINHNSFQDCALILPDPLHIPI